MTARDVAFALFILACLWGAYELLWRPLAIKTIARVRAWYDLRQRRRWFKRTQAGLHDDDAR